MGPSAWGGATGSTAGTGVGAEAAAVGLAMGAGNDARADGCSTSRLAEALSGLTSDVDGSSNRGSANGCRVEGADGALVDIVRATLPKTHAPRGSGVDCAAGGKVAPMPIDDFSPAPDDPTTPDPSKLDSEGLKDAHGRTGRMLKAAGLPFEDDEFDDEDSSSSSSDE